MIPSGDRSLEYYLLSHAGGSNDLCGPMATIAEVLDRLARWSPEAAPTMDLVAVRPGYPRGCPSGGDPRGSGRGTGSC